MLGDGLAVLVPTTLEAAGFLAAFTERSGGVSDGPYRGLNLGTATGDAPAAVVENRSRVCRALDIAPFALARQVHGAGVVRVGPGRAGAGFDGGAPVAEADVLTSASPNVALAVLAADCVPVVLADPDTGRVAVAHAGWRGFAAGVLAAAVAAFPQPARLRAAVGPAIGPDHYEVGEDVAFAVSASSPAGARVRRAGGRVFLDLPGTAEDVLREIGVGSVERAEVCTACEADRFYSHRRDGGRTGRQAVVAMRHSR